MNISILLMEQIIQLFLMIFMGYLIVKVRLVKDEDSKVLSKIILYLIIPCVIINAFQVDYTMDTVKGLLLALAASVMIQVLLLIIAVLPDEASFLPVLCNGGIPDHGLVFVYRVHIKQKDSVGIQVIVHQGKYMLQFLFLCYVIQAVAHADNRSYGSV